MPILHINTLTGANVTDRSAILNLATSCLEWFHGLRTSPGTKGKVGIAGESCCAAVLTLDDKIVFGNSRVVLDGERFHAELCAIEACVQQGKVPKAVFVELAPCAGCAMILNTQCSAVPVYWLFDYYEGQSKAFWQKTFHGQSVDAQISVLRSHMGYG